MNRELPPVTIDESLIGQIVLFTLNDNMKIVLMVTSKPLFIPPHMGGKDTIEGKFIVSDWKLPSSPPIYKDDSIHRYIDIPYYNIKKYQILTKRDLPLLIGYTHTEPLLSELIKGE